MLFRSHPNTSAQTLTHLYNHATQWPAAHYATQRSEVVPVARKAIAEGDDLVVSVDDFTYTGLIKASATNPYAPPPRRPPVTKKAASSSPAIVKKK